METSYRYDDWPHWIVQIDGLVDQIIAVWLSSVSSSCVGELGLRCSQCYEASLIRTRHGEVDLELLTLIIANCYSAGSQYIKHYIILEILLRFSELDIVNILALNRG